MHVHCCNEANQDQVRAGSWVQLCCTFLNCSHMSLSHPDFSYTALKRAPPLYLKPTVGRDRNIPDEIPITPLNFTGLTKATAMSDTSCAISVAGDIIVFSDFPMLFITFHRPLGNGPFDIK